MILILDFIRFSGLIDYGQFKYLTKEEMYETSRLYMALETGDYQKIAQQAWNMGVETEKKDVDYLAKFTIFAYDRIDLEFRDGKSTIQWMTELREQDKVTKLPGNYYLVMRTVFLLRGLAALMQIDVSVAKYWQPFAKEFLENYQPEHVNEWSLIEFEYLNIWVISLDVECRRDDETLLFVLSVALSVVFASINDK